MMQNSMKYGILAGLTHEKASKERIKRDNSTKKVLLCKKLTGIL